MESFAKLTHMREDRHRDPISGFPLKACGNDVPEKWSIYSVDVSKHGLVVWVTASTIMT